MIARRNPEVGYMADDVFKTYAFTQTVKAGQTIYLSGVAPLRGDLKNLEIVGAGDMRVQVAWVLEILKRCLLAEGASFRHLVSQTVYTTDMAELAKTADLFRDAFGEYAPASVWVEIKGLFHPRQMVEISGIAVLE